jgi:two-component system, LytTR family, sensor kinase
VYRRKQGILLRLAVVIIFHLIFKQGDQSFSGAFEPSLRSLLFSVYFITYWMLFWELCRRICSKCFNPGPEKKTNYRKLSFETFILLSLVVFFSIIFSAGYTLMDHFFGVSTDSDLPLINPEIFMLPDIFRFLNVNPELVFGFILFFFLVWGTHLFLSSIKKAKNLEVLTAEQKKENIEAQYAALKNQVNPHFFFNSLSVLSSLVYENPDLSAEYISHMSRHYRYILETNNENLVHLDKELDYLNSYFFLLKIRYPDCVLLRINLVDKTRITCKILPYSLLMLVENAVKHNSFTQEKPLEIEIREDNKYIIVQNNMNKRKSQQDSTGIGLQNISRRYALENRKGILVEVSEGYFVVKLPKLV